MITNPRNSVRTSSKLPRLLLLPLLLLASVAAEAAVVAKWRSDFNDFSYGDNTGSTNWSGNWREYSESDGSGTGDLRIASDTVVNPNVTALFVYDDTSNIYRFFDVSALTYDTVTLKVRYRREGLDDSGEGVNIHFDSTTGNIGLSLKGPADDFNYTETQVDITNLVDTTGSTYIFLNSGLTEAGAEGVSFDWIEIVAETLEGDNIVTGRLFHDVNNNGVWDAGTDVPLPNVSVSGAETDANGLWTLNLPLGQRIITVDQEDPDLPFDFYFDFIEDGTTTINVTGDMNGVDFPMKSAFVNPDLDPISCINEQYGVLVLDASGSIDEQEQVLVRAGTKAYLESLVGRNAFVAITEFGISARTVVPRTLVTAASLTTVFFPAIDNVYHDGTIPGWTNWEAGLKQMNDLINSGSNQPDYVVFITDGEPNHYVGQDGQPKGPHQSTQALGVRGAHDQATILKQSGKHFYGFYIGGAGGNNETIKSISSSIDTALEFEPPEFNVNEADWMQAGTFTEFIEKMVVLGDQVCRGTNSNVITGQVFEDYNGDSNRSDQRPIANGDVSLYRDIDGDGILNGFDFFVETTQTSATGFYQFDQIIPGDYLVVVNSRTLDPQSGYNGGFANGDAWPEQTYGPVDGFCDDGTGGEIQRTSLGPCYAGRNAAVSDDFDANVFEHIAHISMDEGEVRAQIDFGFSWNVVTHLDGLDTRDDDTTTNRMVQGSLRQFADNSNAYAGENHMRFVPTVPSNQSSANGEWWQFAITNPITTFGDASTTIDGRAWQFTDGTIRRDALTGTLGTGGSVGAGPDGREGTGDENSLTLVERPELEIIDANGLATGLDLSGSLHTIRDLSVHGFGDAPNDGSNASILVQASANNATVQTTLVGFGPDAIVAPASIGSGDGIRSLGGDSGTVTNSIAAYTGGSGVSLGGSSLSWLIENNEFTAVGPGSTNVNVGGVRIGGTGSDNNIVRGNLITNNSNAGVVQGTAGDNNTFQFNTITANGLGSGGANAGSTAGIRTAGDGHLFAQNIIASNYGAGILGHDVSTGITFTQNAIYDNGEDTDSAGGAATGQIGIDLLANGDNRNKGTAGFVTLNDSGDGDSGANGLLNFPVIESAILRDNGDLAVTGFARPGSIVEVFVANNDASSFGEGETYLFTVAEGSNDDSEGTTGSYSGPVNGIDQGADTTNRFYFVKPADGLITVGGFITSTATDANGATSEFSGVTQVLPSMMDYGDAPASFGEPSHEVVTGIYLGAAEPDVELAAQHTTNADGDDNDGTDDEDGTDISGVTFARSQNTFLVFDVAGAGGFLQGWVDWNNNGVFDTGEQAIVDLQDDNSSGSIEASIDVPANAFVGDVIARFRWSTIPGINADTAGLANGEVEDYVITIIEPPYSVEPSEVCGVVAPFNSENYSSNTDLSGLLPLTFLDSTFTFDAVLNGIAVWANGPQVQQVDGHDILYLQPRDAYIPDGAFVEYTMDFPIPAGTVEFLIGGVNHYDSLKIMPEFQGNSIAITDANFDGQDAYSSLSIVNGDTLEANTDSSGGTLVHSGLVKFSVTGPVDKIKFISGKAGSDSAAANNGTNTISLVAFDVCPVANDYGDGPASFGAPSHQVSTSMYIGATPPDAEVGPQHTVSADGDDSNGTNDEDSNYINLVNFVRGQNTPIAVPVTGAGGLLYGWIDFNGNGSFEPEEQILGGFPDVDGDGSIGGELLVPEDAALGEVLARIRWSTTAGLDFDTVDSAEGEVEDHIINILDTPPDNPPLTQTDCVIPAGNPTAALTASEVSFDITTPGNVLPGSEVRLNAVTIVGENKTFNYLVHPDTVNYQFASPSANRQKIRDHGADTGVNITDGPAVFDPALLEANNDRDLRHYLVLDSGISSTDRVDFLYNTPVISAKNRYILLQERFGNNLMSAEALDANGNVIGGSANAIPNDTYIDTGFQIEENQNQHAFIAVYPLTAIAPAGTAIHGIRYTQIGATGGDGGDGKVFIMASPDTVCALGTISGNVFEDVNADSDRSDNRAITGGTVHLYTDSNSNGVVDGDDNLVASTTTDASGDYLFTDLSPSNYLVAVDSRTLDPQTGYNAGTDNGDGWAEQTWGSIGAVCDDGTGGTNVRTTLGACYGGRNANASDDVAAGVHEHVVSVALPLNQNQQDVDFGFSWNAVTNVEGGDGTDNDAGTNRTVQGSLRQFIQNSNSYVGANEMRFVPTVPTNQTGAGGSWWRLPINRPNELPSMEDSFTTIDGRAWDFTDGTLLRNQNTGDMGEGGTVGTGPDAVVGTGDEHVLGTVERPELEITDGGGTNRGLHVIGSNHIIRNTSIWGFGLDAGSGSSSPGNASIEVESTGSNTLIENMVLGSSPDQFIQPVPGDASNPSDPDFPTNGNHIFIHGATSGIVRDSLIGWGSLHGISTDSNTSGWLFENLEVRRNGLVSNAFGGINLAGSSSNNTIRHSLLTLNTAGGVEFMEGTSNNIMEDNSNIRNGIGAADIGSDPSQTNSHLRPAGMHLGGANNTVIHNIITDSYTSGVFVGRNAANNTISRNSIFQNGVNPDSNGAGSVTGAIGIDLSDSPTPFGSGFAPYVTLNDVNDADTGGGHDFYNFPVLESAILNPDGSVTIIGFTRPNSIVEFFVSDQDPRKFGEGQTYFGTATEGSGDDNDATTGSYGPDPVNGVAQGEDTTNRFSFTLPAGAYAAGDEVTSTATNTSGATSEFSGVVLIQERSTDLELTKTVTETTINESFPFFYNITLTNKGPETATNVVVYDGQPDGIYVLSATPSVGTFDTATGEWTIPSIAINDPQTLSLRVLAVAGTAGDTLVNVAEVTAADQLDVDSTVNNQDLTEDDIATATITVNARPTNPPTDSGLACYMAAGESAAGTGDHITTIDAGGVTGTELYLGDTTSNDLRGFAVMYGSQELWGAGGNRLYALSSEDGSESGQVFTGGGSNGSAGFVTLNNFVAIASDPSDTAGQYLYAVHQRTGPQTDLIALAHSAFGGFFSGAFVGGNDYIVVEQPTVGGVLLEDVSAIAADPLTGYYYIVLQNAGANDHLAIVDMNTGGIYTETVVPLSQQGIRGITFDNQGNLYAVAGDSTSTFYSVDKITGSMSAATTLGSGVAGIPAANNPLSVYEGIACNLPLQLSISGVVFEDADTSSSFNGSDTGLSGVEVVLYQESTGQCIAQATTDANGNYSFTNVAAGDYQVIEAEGTNLGLDSSPSDNTAVSCTPANLSANPAGFDSTTPNTQEITLNIDDTITNRAFTSIWPASLASVDFGETQGTPFASCDAGAFQSAGSPGNIGFYQVDLPSGETTLYPAGNSTNYNNINALGYNELDNYIYAYDQNLGQFTRIDSNGNWTQLSATAGQVSGERGAGTIIGEGYWVLGSRDSATVQVIDVDPNRSTYLKLVLSLDLPEQMGSSDWAWNPVDGNVYLIEDGTNQVYRLLLSFLDGGAPSVSREFVGSAGSGTLFSESAGAQYFDNEGNFYYQINETGIFYRISDMANRAPGAEIMPVEISQGEVTFANDGAGCMPTIAFDFGDAPDSYPIAKHNISALQTGVLGTLRDFEDEPVSNANATGDDLNSAGNDDDGITSGGNSLQGQIIGIGSSDLTVTASLPGFVSAWFDFNGDGDFDDANEQVAVNAAVIAGANTLTISPLLTDFEGFSGSTFARFRYTESAHDGLTPGGFAVTGEVEDYNVIIGLPQISGVVFVDADVSSSFNIPEAGINTVEVVLYDEASGLCIGQAVTDASGGYTFTGVTPGDYQVIEAEGASFSLDDSPADNVGVACTPSSVAADPSGFVSTTPNIQVITMNADGTITNRATPSLWPATLTSVDFGENQETSIGQCTAAYQTQGSNGILNLYELDVATASLDPFPAGNSTVYEGINALGFNRVDGFLYGSIGVSGSPTRLSRIDQNGQWAQFTATDGLIPYRPSTGTINDEGYWIIARLDDPRVYVVDVDASRSSFMQVVNSFTLPVNMDASDIAWNPVDSEFYFIEDSTFDLHRLSFNGPVQTATSASRVEIRQVGNGISGFSAGAQYFDLFGNMYFQNNDTGSIYRIADVSNLSPGGSVDTTLIATGSQVFQNDGAGCVPLIQIDFSDAPAAYPTASHTVQGGDSGVLGALRDFEEAALVSDSSDGDDGDAVDDDDGITLGGNDLQGQTIEVGSTELAVTTTQAGFLSAWVDFNGDGDFDDANEQVATNLAVPAGVSALTITPTLADMAGYTGNSVARFRYTEFDHDGLAIDGPASTGEVEDYQVVIDPRATYIGLAKRAEVNGQNVTFTLRVKGHGPKDLNAVQIVENLDGTFGVGNYTVATPVLTNSVEGTTALTLNSNWDGTAANDTLLEGTGTIDAGGVATITFVATIINITDQGNGVGNFVNQAQATALRADLDPTDPAAALSDLSDNGISDDDDDNGNPTEHDAECPAYGEAGFPNDDGTDELNCDNDPTPIMGNVDLELAKTVDNASPTEGGQVSYTITLLNNGPQPASSVVVSEPLPQGLTVVSGTPSAGTYDAAANTWTVSALAVNAPQTLVIVATTDVGTAGATLVNVAEIIAHDDLDIDSVPNNQNAAEDDQATVSITVQPLTPPNVPDANTCYLLAGDSAAGSGDHLTTGIAGGEGYFVGLGNTDAVGIATQPGSGFQYFVNSNSLKVIDPNTLQVTRIGSPGLANGPEGPITLDNLVELAFDPYDASGNTLYAVHRRAAAADILVLVDPDTGVIKPGSFSGDDYVVLNGGLAGYDNINAIAIDPADRTFYAILGGAGNDRLVSLDSFSGTVNNDFGALSFSGATGMSFPNTGLQALVTTANNAFTVTPASFSVSSAFALGTAVAGIPPANDPLTNYQGVTCGLPPVDLAVTKTVSPASVGQNQAITWTVTVTNESTALAGGVVIEDRLGAGLTFDSASPNKGFYDSPSDSWFIDYLAAGETATLQLTSTSPANASGQMVENVAELVSLHAFDTDSTPANDVPAEDDQDSAQVTMGMVEPAPVCDGQKFSVVDWARIPAALGTTQVDTQYGITSTVTVSQLANGANAAVWADTNVGYDANFGVNPVRNYSGADIVVQFDRPLSQLSFYYTDLDTAGEIGTVSGSLGGVAVTPGINLGPQASGVNVVVNIDQSLSVSDDPSDGSADLSDELRAVIIGFNTPVDQITISSSSTGASTQKLADIQLCADFSDAPLLESQAAVHIGSQASGVYLGSAVDSDAGPYNVADATGDGADDDGVLLGGSSLQGQTLTFGNTNSVTLDVTTVGAGTLYAFFDFNADGDFDDAGEALPAVVSSGGAISLNVDLADDLIDGPTFARFRYSNSGAANASSPTGAVDAGEVEDYQVIFESGGVTVSGRVYHDENHNAAAESAEDWSDGVPVVVNLVSNGTIIATTTVDPGTGEYSFENVLAGNYDIVVTDSSTSSTAQSPAGWIPVQPDPLLQSIAVTDQSITNQNFGLFHGSTLEGSVIRDTGDNSGTANDAIQNGGEPGIGGITIVASDTGGGTVYDTTTTTGDGSYTLWIPFAADNQVVAVTETNASGFISTGGDGGTTGGSYTVSNDQVQYLNVAGNSYENIDFFDVPGNEFSPDGEKTTRPGGVVFYAHTFTAGTAGAVNFTFGANNSPASDGWGRSTFLDLDCNGELDAGEPALAEGADVNANAGDNVCIIVKVQAPSSAQNGAQQLLSVTANFDYANSALTDTLVRTDLTRTGGDDGAGLVLSKVVDQLQARPGQILTYTVTYKNNSARPLGDIVVNDSVPAFTTFVDASCPANLPQALTACQVTEQPAPGTTGALVWTLDGELTPGAEGEVTFRVKIDE